MNFKNKETLMRCENAKMNFKYKAQNSWTAKNSAKKHVDNAFQA